MEMKENQWEWVSETRGRLDKLLATRFPEFSRTQWHEVIRDGLVKVDGVAGKAGLAVVAGSKLSGQFPAESAIHSLEPAAIALEIPFEDEHLLVVNKPAGMVTHPAPGTHDPTLVNALLGLQIELSHGSKAYRPGIVHRLDKETSGLMLVAKSDFVHRKLSEMIQKREVDRRYLAVVEGTPRAEAFDVEGPIARDPKNRLKMAIVEGGKSSLTHFRVLREVSELALLEAKLETGRTHQIRVHLASVGNPVIGDRLYGSHRLDVSMQLQAYRLQLVHPMTAAKLEIQIPPPADFLISAAD